MRWTARHGGTEERQTEERQSEYSLAGIMGCQKRNNYIHIPSALVLDKAKDLTKLRNPPTTVQSRSTASMATDYRRDPKERQKPQQLCSGTFFQMHLHC